MQLNTFPQLQSQNTQCFQTQQIQSQKIDFQQPDDVEQANVKFCTNIEEQLKSGLQQLNNEQFIRFIESDDCISSSPNQFRNKQLDGLIEKQIDSCVQVSYCKSIPNHLIEQSLVQNNQISKRIIIYQPSISNSLKNQQQQYQKFNNHIITNQQFIFQHQFKQQYQNNISVSNSILPNKQFASSLDYFNLDQNQKYTYQKKINNQSYQINSIHQINQLQSVSPQYQQSANNQQNTTNQRFKQPSNQNLIQVTNNQNLQQAHLSKKKIISQIIENKPQQKIQLNKGNFYQDLKEKPLEIKKLKLKDYKRKRLFNIQSNIYSLRIQDKINYQTINNPFFTENQYLKQQLEKLKKNNNGNYNKFQKGSKDKNHTKSNQKNQRILPKINFDKINKHKHQSHTLQSIINQKLTTRGTEMFILKNIPKRWYQSNSLNKSANKTNVSFKLKQNYSSIEVVNIDPTKSLAQLIKPIQLKADFILLPPTPRPNTTQTELLRLGKQIFSLFGIKNISNKSIKVSKYQNCVVLSLSNQKTIVWHFEGNFYYGSWMYFQNGGGIKHGYGFQQVTNKFVYQGSFKNNKRNGQGMMRMINGSTYIGQWKEGDKNGYGKYIDNLFIYEGNWKDGKKEGEGKLINKITGEIYEGSFSKGLKNGEGVESFKNGDFYKGQYLDGNFHGKGYYKWKNGSQYLGEFKQGKRFGLGLWKSQKQDIYQGNYQNNNKSGFGVYRWADGSIYQGQFLNDLLNGNGKLLTSKGQVINCKWKNGQPLIEQTKTLKIKHLIQEKN